MNTSIYTENTTTFLDKESYINNTLNISSLISISASSGDLIIQTIGTTTTNIVERYCQACTVANCKTCATDLATCDACIDGFYLSGNTCTCKFIIT